MGELSHGVLASVLGQSFDAGDLAVVGILAVLEITLSIDNALVLGLLAQRVPPRLRRKALSYGLAGALVLRVIAAALAAYLLHWSWLKLIGGIYLLWLAIKLFMAHAPPRRPASRDIRMESGLWKTVLTIELTDMTFAADSILAAVALIGPAPEGEIHPKLWVIIAGGMLGVVAMRFAAVLFSSLIERFPRLDRSAALLVGVIGAKLMIDWAVNQPDQPPRVDFQDPRAAPMWIFWAAMAASVAVGMVRKPGDHFMPPRPD